MPSLVGSEMCIRDRVDTINTKLQNFAFMAQASTNSVLENDWILDSGASSHMTSYYSDCFNISKTQASIKLADGTHTTCTHQGEATLNFTDDLGIQRLVHLQKVLIVPDLDRRLLSVTQFSTVYGDKITFSIYGVLLQFPQGTQLTLPPPNLVSTACLIRTSKPKKLILMYSMAALGIVPSMDFTLLAITVSGLTWSPNEISSTIASPAL